MSRRRPAYAAEALGPSASPGVRPPTRVLGILNATPDSFSDGGGLWAAGALDVEAALRRARELVNDGAHALDIGGESTRPGAREVSVDEELRRVIPLLEALGRDFPVPISIDTRRASVAAAAADLGASIVNDTSALRDDPELGSVVAERGLGLVLMHRQGTPENMQRNPHYDDLIAEVGEFFEERIEAALAAGVAESRLILDPGLGFGKARDDNYRLVARLAGVRRRGLPLLIGASRKSFLGRFDVREYRDRQPGSLAFVAAAHMAGAEWVRVHDVRETVLFLETLQAIEEAQLC
ncbi:MAG: dihydropteroate synthase [Planctomycetota bacterium]